MMSIFSLAIFKFLLSLTFDSLIKKWFNEKSFVFDLFGVL